MTWYVAGEWNGWDGDTVVKLTGGTVWKQDEYWCSYRYSYRPEATTEAGKMLVKVISRRSAFGGCTDSHRCCGVIASVAGVFSRP